MNTEMFGNLVLLLGIISSGILFIVVNVDYRPEDNKDDTLR